MRKCLSCGEQLCGRSDQKFCNDNCRSAYNRSKYVKPGEVNKINQILRKNYLILSTLNKTGETSVKKSEIIDQGFCFDYYTQMNDLGCYCYDQLYQDKGDELILTKTPISY
jgi:hypothetical protein